ncbi:MAG: hypothetical protein ACOCY3_01100 [Desulfosalsimonas sp.]
MGVGSVLNPFTLGSVLLLILIINEILAVFIKNTCAVFIAEMIPGPDDGRVCAAKTGNGKAPSNTQHYLDNEVTVLYELWTM